MSDARLVAHQSRYDLLSVCRDPQSRFFTIVLPLIFLRGALVPKDQLSSTLRDIARVFPVSHILVTYHERDSEARTAR
jgi:hypothetical protein